MTRERNYKGTDMGLSSSQARLLNLTSRMHQIEYKAARLEAMKLQMANESTRVYEDYLNALETTKVQVKTLTTDGAVTFVDVNDYGAFISAGYALVFAGSIVFDNSSTSKNLEALIKTIAAVVNPGSIPNPALTGDTDNIRAITNAINSGYVTIVSAQSLNSSSSPVFPEYGTLEFIDHQTSVSTATGLQEVEDTKEIKKAEAKYEADMKRIDMKDRKFDQDLAALDAERNAVKQEMETLKTVAKDNVERTFKLFS